jgi:hypothetical protein
MRGLNAAMDSRLTREQAVHIVDAIVNQYPNKQGITEMYLAGIAKVLMQYPLPVAVSAADPIMGVPAEIYPFLPVSGELIEWLDRRRSKFLRRGMSAVSEQIAMERARDKNIEAKKQG